MSLPLMEKLSHYMDITDADKRLLENAVQKRVTFGKQKEIIRQGDKPDYVLLIEEGWACRYKLLEHGEQHIMAYLLPGDLFDVNFTLLDCMDHSIRSLTPVKAALYPAEAIKDLMDENRRLRHALLWSTLVDEAILREWLVNAGIRPADKRIAHIFCELLIRSRIAGLTDSDSFEMPLTQAELAETMGLSSVHVNRTIQRLRNEGLITLGKRELSILDWERMAEFAQFDPIYLHCQNKPCTELGLQQPFPVGWTATKSPQQGPSWL